MKHNLDINIRNMAQIKDILAIKDTCLLAGRCLLIHILPSIIHSLSNLYSSWALFKPFSGKWKAEWYEDKRRMRDILDENNCEYETMSSNKNHLQGL